MRRLLFLALLLLLLSAPLFYLYSLADLTLSVDARTETVSWEVRPRPSGDQIVLPEGELSFVTILSSQDGGAEPAMERLVSRGDIVVAISKAADLRAFVGPGTCELTIEITPKNGGKISAYLMTDAERNLELGTPVTYSTKTSGGQNCADARTRLLLSSARRIVIGDSLYTRETRDIDSERGRHRVLVSGELYAHGDDALAFSPFGLGTRQRLAHGQVDFGDTIKIEASEEAPEARVWGSIEWQPVGTEGPIIRVVAHTRHDRIEVERYGGGYHFGVSVLQVVQQHPFVQALMGLLAILLTAIAAFPHARQTK